MRYQQVGCTRSLESVSFRWNIWIVGSFHSCNQGEALCRIGGKGSLLESHQRFHSMGQHAKGIGLQLRYHDTCKELSARKNCL